jgi:hypothetical protein
MTSGLPEAAEDDLLLGEDEPELLQDATAVQRMAATARLFMILFIA